MGVFIKTLNEEKKKAFKDWQKDFDWSDYEIAHNDGFDAGVKAEQEKIMKVITDKYEALSAMGMIMTLWPELFPQEPQQEGER